MPKYISGRSKKTPQSALPADRYRYLSVGDAEPNLGDSPEVAGSPNLPVGQQYIVVSFIDRPGERFWIPNQGGLIPGSFSIFDEGTLVGGLSSTTQLNFIGQSITAAGFGTGTSNPGVAVTLTVAPPGNLNEVLFVGAGGTDFATDTRFTFNNGLFAAGDRITVGTGGTVITTTGIGSVGIGTTEPTQKLHLDGNFRITGTIYDSTNQPGNNGDLITKTATGSLLWISPDSTITGAGGTIGQIQFHSSAGLVDGADNFYYDFNNNRVGIGSTQPTQLLDVLGVSTFSGGVFVDTFSVSGNSIFTGLIDANGGIDATTLNVSGLSTFGSNVDINASVDISTNLDVDGTTDLDVLNVSETASFTNTTDNTLGNTNTGGVQIDGGVGIDKNLTVGQTIQATNLNITGVGTIATFDFGVGQFDNIEVLGVSTLGNVVVNTNTISTKSGAGNLILDSDGSVQINDPLNVTGATESTSKDSGSIITEGGIGVEKSVFIGLNLDVDGNTELDTLNVSVASTTASLTVGTGVAVTTILDEDDMSSDSNTALATQQSIKKYVDDQITIEDLDFAGDTGSGSVDLDSQTFTIAGTTNEIETSGSNQTLTIGLPDNVTVSGNLTVNGNTDLGNTASDTVTFAARIDSNLLPSTNGTLDLGGTSNEWNNVYANTFVGAITGNADSATQLANARNFSISGDGTAPNVSFNGTANVDLALTLANTAVTPGSYGSSTQVGTFTVDSKGRLTAASNTTIDFGNATVNKTDNLVGGAAGSLPYQSAADTTTFLAEPNANDKILSYNNTTNAPIWIDKSSVGVDNYVDSVSFSGGTLTLGRTGSLTDLTASINLSDIGSNTFVNLSDTPANYTSAAGKVVKVNSSGNALEFVDSSTAGKTYTLEGVDSGDNAILRLSDGTTNDDVLITAGSNITIDPVAAGGFTIAAVAGAGLGVAASANDILSVINGQIAADDAGGDKIFFWDDSAGKATHLTAGTGLTISGTTITANSDAGKTYTLTAVDDGNNVKLRLGDGTTNDDVLITAGSNITIDPVAAGGFTISASGGGSSDKIEEGNTSAEVVDTGTDGHFKVLTEGAERLRITSTGFVGIGEDAPDSLLHIGKGTNTDDGAVTLTIGGSSANTRQSTITKNNVGSGDRALEIHAATGGSDETIKFFSDDTTERLRIGTNGQIGLSGANYGTSGQVLTSNGASSAPTWQNASGGSGGGGSSDPVGTIVAWAGSAATIPSEYQLCDGSAASTSALQAITGSNVPDLRDRFIVGAGSGYTVNATGGAATHTLTIGEMPSHNHPFPQNSNGTYDYYWKGQSDAPKDFEFSAGSTPPYELTTTNAIASQGGGQAHNNLPPYYALCYIIKHTATSGGGTGTLTDVDVKQYANDNNPRTEYSCSNPIEVTVNAGIATIGIGSTSNAFGKRYVGTTEPTSDVCDGDIWYDTSPGSSGGFVTGMIMMFSGTTAPTGWVLCDNSTAAQAANAPDLRDRFIVGTGNSYNLNATGGSANAVLIAHSHVHNNDIVEEGNEFSIGPGNRSASSKNDSTEITGVDASGNASTTQTGTNANLPPYYALAFIMKT